MTPTPETPDTEQPSQPEDEGNETPDTPVVPEDNTLTLGRAIVSHIGEPWEGWEASTETSKTATNIHESVFRTSALKGVFLFFIISLL